MKTTPLAGCVITDTAGKILVIHRNTSNLVQWELPGGKVEKGETFQQAVQREAREEIGVEIAVGEELGQADFVDRNIKWEYHWFKARIVNGEPYIGEPDRYDGIMYADILQDNVRGDTMSINLHNLRRAIESGEVDLS